MLPSGVLLTQHGHGLIQAQGCYTIQKKGTAVMILLFTAALCLPVLHRKSTCPQCAQTLFAWLLSAGLRKNHLASWWMVTFLPKTLDFQPVLCVLALFTEKYVSDFSFSPFPNLFIGLV